MAPAALSGSDTLDAAEAAESVFAYVARTAEPQPDGVRWRTLSYKNEPQYDVTLYNGVAGTSLFLSDYFRVTGSAEARELARGALEWCSSPARGVSPGGLLIGGSTNGGGAGVGWAWLRFSEVGGGEDAVRRAEAFAQPLLEAPPGPWTDLMAGAAGECLFLLRLWQATRDERYLTAAVRNAEWLDGVAHRDERGVLWPFRVTQAKPWSTVGYAHGLAGSGASFVSLYEVTREQRWADVALECADTLARLAFPDRGGLNWPYLPDGGGPSLCQWCHGATGIGHFYVRAYEALGRASDLALARGAGEATFAYGDSRENPCQCHGLAGSGELFLELHRVTRDSTWLGRARDFGRRALVYRTLTPEGVTWQADDAGYDSPDFFCGAAGVGHFYLRLAVPHRVPLAIR